ncbi:MAG TPA: DUF6036 family nucleotidyltransferase [Thermoanaerobaculia bacterium]|nr:DUF6036 family nucleotidyltransferase [Thermoanaerobaculia bacterium]
MREVVTSSRVREFMRVLAAESHAEGRVYLTGGATAVLLDWRDSTVDIDIKIIPDDGRVFDVIPSLKERLGVNVELASPTDFIPEVPGWRERSPFIVRERSMSFHHYDFYSQCLAKLERALSKDLLDVQHMVDSGLIEPERLREFYEQIEPQLKRYPAIDPPTFRRAVEAFIARQ